MIRFESFPSEFDCVKPLCGDSCFLFTGTPKDIEIFYGPIIKAFNNNTKGRIDCFMVTAVLSCEMTLVLVKDNVPIPLR